MTSRDFSTYRLTLEMVPPFKYLAIVISVADDDWPAVLINLVKARKV